MCFVTTKSTTAKIAKTDIKCRKYLRKDNISPCRFLFKYEENIVSEKVEIKKEKTPESETGIGIGIGYHSYKDARFAPYWLRANTFVKTFIIPAGTRYFENKKEYVSETIMLIK